MNHLSVRMLFFAVVVGASVYLSLDSFPISSYIMAIKENDTVPVFEYSMKNPLYEKIKAEAPEKNIFPIDARKDKVWEGVPGHNGREVDIAATYKETISQKESRNICWKYREVKPKRSLDDLGAVPIYRGNEHKKMVALMINVSINEFTKTEHITSMLQTLQEKKARATFFVDGIWLKKNTDVAKRIFAAGHEIGNHAYSHPLMANITKDRIFHEIKKTNDLLFDVLHIQSHYFAPPAGSFDQRTVDVAHGLKMKTILWTLDMIDWRKSSTSSGMIAKVRNKIQPGYFVLMHPTDRTAMALPRIIEEIEKKNLHLGTLSEVLSPKRID